MNCRRRAGTAKAMAPDNPSKPGNGVQDFADTNGMEFKRRVAEPYWEDPPVVLDAGHED